MWKNLTQQVEKGGILYKIDIEFVEKSRPYQIKTFRFNGNIALSNHSTKQRKHRKESALALKNAMTALTLF